MSAGPQERETRSLASGRQHPGSSTPCNKTQAVCSILPAWVHPCLPEPQRFFPMDCGVLYLLSPRAAARSCSTPPQKWLHLGRKLLCECIACLQIQKCKRSLEGQIICISFSFSFVMVIVSLVDY